MFLYFFRIDGAVAKLFPKSSRKREKQGQKLEQLCKKQGLGSQKNKHHGRKSTPRASYHESGRKDSEVRFCFWSMSQ